MHPERWTFDWFYNSHVPEACFGKTSEGETVKGYNALLIDGAEKRARAESVDSLPTTAQMWDMLRRAYGTKLVGATLVAVIDNDGTCTVQTLTFPGPNGA